MKKVSFFVLVVSLMLFLADRRETGRVVLAETAQIPTEVTYKWQCWNPQNPSNPCNSASTITNSYLDLEMLSANEGWAVGTNGKTMRWRGMSWEEVTTPVTVTLLGVDFLSSNSGWAVGDLGTIIRWNGVQWVSVPSPTQIPLTSVSMVNENFGWAVGAPTNNNLDPGGILLRWNGQQWENSNLDLASGRIRPYDIKMISATDGYFVGSVNATTPFFSRWDGSTSKWSGVGSLRSEAILFQPLKSVDAMGSDNVWTVGEDGVWGYWDGVKWTPSTGFGGLDYGDVSISPEGDVWVVGIFQAGAFYKWNGSDLEWAGITADQSPRAPMALDMVSNRDGWAVGVNGAVYRYMVDISSLPHRIYLPTVSR